MPSTCTSSISSSSSPGGRRLLPPCPDPGPAPHRPSHLTRRNLPGPVTAPALPPAPDSSGKGRGPSSLCSLAASRSPQSHRSQARPLALFERAPRVLRFSSHRRSNKGSQRTGEPSSETLHQVPGPRRLLTGQGLGASVLTGPGEQRKWSIGAARNTCKQVSKEMLPKARPHPNCLSPTYYLGGHRPGPGNW